MALTLASWEAVVRRKLAKSAEFKELDHAVRDYIGSPEQQHVLKRLRDRWLQWNAKLARGRKTFRGSDRYQHGCALDDIEALFERRPPGNKVTVIDGVNERQTVVQILGVQSASLIEDSPRVNWDEPPYVRIGNVFASLTILGTESWGYLPLRFPTQNFKILSGRHGNVINPIASNGRLLLSQEAPQDHRPLAERNVADPARDREIRERVNHDKRRGSFYVDVVDVRTEDFRTGSGLKNRIGIYLADNYFVVLGWCYGLYTFVASKSAAAEGQDVSNPNNPLYARWQEVMAMPVADVVARWWSWVPK